MKASLPAVRISTGVTVRLDGHRHLVGPLNENGRVFTDKESGTERHFNMNAIRRMVCAARITTDAAWSLIDASVLAALEIDWGAFSETERQSALEKFPYVKAIHDLPQPWRQFRKHVLPALERVAADPEHAGLHKPTFRQARTWYLKWSLTGPDIRALVDMHRLKGNRTPRQEAWIMEEVYAAIDETYRNELKSSMAEAGRRARDRVILRAAAEGRKIPDFGQKEGIGKNLAPRTIRGMDKYDLARVRHGRPEADRMFTCVATGPDGDYPLAEAEVDHTLLDIIVIDSHGRYLGRPWLTVIVDRYSRMVIGFSLSFHPPSWTSVMEALRIAVLPKEKRLQEIVEASGRGVGFEYHWPCFAAPDRLFCDNGREFRSASMKATEAALNMKIVDLPRRKPWLKGKVERFLRTLNQRLIHNAPGTTKSNPKARGRYDSKKKAVLTIEDANWVVAKWIVDIYHTERHSRTGEAPLARWEHGMCGTEPKLAPPEGLIAPLVGRVVNRKLRNDGVRFKKLRWNSDAFSALLDRIGFSVDVTIRIDPLDIRKAYILDPDPDDDRDSWIEGDLQADEKTAGLTLHQYEFLQQRKAEIEATEVLDEEGLLKRARANQDIYDLFDERQGGRASVRGRTRFVTDGRKPAAHVHGEREAFDADDDLEAHEIDSPEILPPPPDPRGPWRDRVPALAPPPGRLPAPPLPPTLPTEPEPPPSPPNGTPALLPVRRRKP